MKDYNWVKNRFGTRMANILRGFYKGSIENIKVTESHVSGGNNVVTITKMDGTETSFNVKNGKDGANGVYLGDVEIADNLMTNDAKKVLSAKQGKELKGMVDKKLNKDVIYGNAGNYIEGAYLSQSSSLPYVKGSINDGITPLIPVQNGDKVMTKCGYASGDGGRYFWLYDANGQPLTGLYYNAYRTAPVTINNANVAFMRSSFSLLADDAHVIINGEKAWEFKKKVIGMAEWNYKSVGIAKTIYDVGEYTCWANGYVNSTSGAQNNSSINSCTGFIEVEDFDTIEITMSTVSSSQNNAAVCFYDSNGTFISSVLPNVGTEDGYETRTLNVPYGAKYVRCTIYTDYIQYWKMVGYHSDVKDEFKKFKNHEEWEDGYQIYTNEGVGEKCRLARYDSPSFRCLMVPCKPAQHVLITKGTGGISPRLWCFLDRTYTILAVADTSLVAEDLNLVAPAETAWLVCNDTQKDGEVYIYDDVLPSYTVLLDKLNNDIQFHQQVKRTSNLKDWGTQPAANGTDGSFCDVNGSYQDLLASVYEPLRQSYPNYIKRVNIGKDASGTIDMYAYVFEPRYYQQSVYLQAGIHGIEVDAVACLARIMYLIANATNSDEDLMYLRQTVKFTVIPCVNVWGFSQSPKNNNNSNNAALQQWSSLTPPQEIANIKAYIEAESLTDELSYMLDMHTTTNNTYYDFYGNIQRHAKNVRTIFRTNAWLCDNYAQDGRTVDDQYLGYYEPANNILFRQYYYYNYGVQTATLELSDYHWDSQLSTSPVITMGVTMWLNYIVQMVNDFYVLMSDIPSEDYRPSRG